MNLQNDFNKLNSSIQEVFKDWGNKILPHLPQQMDEMAKRTGAMQRKRGVCSAIDLLRMLFLYASSNFSFRILAAAACALGISVISDTAWRKHFSKAAPFLREIHAKVPFFHRKMNQGFSCMLIRNFHLFHPVFIEGIHRWMRCWSCCFPSWRMTDASTRSTFFTFPKAEISAAGRREESREYTSGTGKRNQRYL